MQARHADFRIRQAECDHGGISVVGAIGRFGREWGLRLRAGHGKGGETALLRNGDVLNAPVIRRRMRKYSAEFFRTGDLEFAPHDLLHRLFGLDPWPRSFAPATRGS